MQAPPFKTNAIRIEFDQSACGDRVGIDAVELVGFE